MPLFTGSKTSNSRLQATFMSRQKYQYLDTLCYLDRLQIAIWQNSMSRHAVDRPRQAWTGLDMLWTVSREESRSLSDND